MAESHILGAHWLSLYGAILATGLAVFRVWELYRDRRPNLRLVAGLTSDPHEGHSLTLLNASKIPAGIWCYDLVWTKAGPLRRRLPIGIRVEHEESPLGHDTCNIKVEAHGQYSLEFRGLDYFPWDGRHGQTRWHVYLRLWLVGRRRPIWLWVTGPNR